MRFIGGASRAHIWQGSLATYAFETIGAADALNFNSTADTLAFTTPGSSASSVAVAFDLTPGGYRETAVTSGVTGRTVLFRFVSDSPNPISCPDGSKVIIGPRIDLVGGNEPDAIFAGPETLSLKGGGGDDTLVGGFELERFYGGAGNDLFIINPRYSSTYSLLDSQDYIEDWHAGDRLSFGPMAVTDADIYKTTATLGDELNAANAAIASGRASIVAMQFGDNVLIYADSHQDHGQADDLVWLMNTNLADVNAGIFAATPAQPAFAPPASNEPQLPAAPAVSGYDVYANFNGDMDVAHIGDLYGAAISTATATELGLGGLKAGAHLTGTGFVYDRNEQLIGGTVTGAWFGESPVGQGPDFVLSITGLSAPAAPFGQWVMQDATQAAFSALLPGHDVLVGGSGPDLIRVYQGDHIIHGGGGADSLFGGNGDDQIYVDDRNSQGAPTWLRGGGGNDYIVGGSAFDNVNGNLGNDTISGAAGDDWVLGGQGDDMVFGGVGNDIINGNIGKDTCVGGDGADTVRGGQGDDVLYGDAGDDWLSGDLGANTITGGAGADTFHGGAGHDVVTPGKR